MADPEGGDEERPSLVIDELADRFERFRLLRMDDGADTDAILEEFGASSQVERDIVVQLSLARPLGHPERFVESHHLAMHALEVLDRNGSRSVKAPKGLGPLRPVAGFFLQLITRFLVRQHQRSVIDAIGDVYVQRIAWTSIEDPVRMVLLRASRDVERAKNTFKGNPVGIPTFLLGGAIVSGIGGALRSAVDAAGTSRTIAGLAILLLTLVLGALSWTILHAAGVARRRIRLTVERPIAALWETVGGAGKPPKDQARQFAIYAVILTAVSWIVVPAGLVFIFNAID